MSDARQRVAPRETLRARFVKGTLWSLVGTVLAQGLTVVASIVTARLLGRSGFGEFGIINTTVAAFGLLAGLGLGLTATKYLAELRDSDPRRAGRVFGLCNVVGYASSAIASVSCFVFAPYLASHTLNAPHLVFELRIGCAALFFNAIAGVQNGALAGLEAFRLIAGVNLVKGLLTFPFLIVGTWAYGLPGALMAMAFVGACGWLLNERALRREFAGLGIVSRYKGISEESQILWTFALPALLSGALVSPVQWLASTIVVSQAGGYDQMGLLSASLQWRTALIFLPSIFVQVALPLMASQSGEQGQTIRTDHRLIEATQALTVVVVLPATALLMFLTDWIMALYGPAFREGAVVLVVLLAGVLFQGAGTSTGPVIQARGKMWLGFLINFSWGVVLLAFVALTAPRLGALALAGGLSLAYLVTTTLGFLYLRRDLPEGLLARAFGALGIGLALTVAATLLPPNLRTLAALPAAFSVTAATWFLLLTEETRQAARNLFRWR